MTKTLSAISFFLILTVTAWPNVNSNLKTKIEKYFIGKEYAILQVDKIPTLPPSGMLRRGMTIIIKNGGEWQQPTTLGMRRAYRVTLRKYEILEIKRVKFNRKGLTIEIRTFEQLPTGMDKKYEHHRTLFKFYFDSQYINNPSERNLNFITASIEKYFKFFKTPELAKTFLKEGESKDAIDIKVEIKLGMTINEVIHILGEPNVTKNDGDQLIFKYDDMTIVFRSGKVISVVL